MRDVFCATEKRDRVRTRGVVIGFISVCIVGFLGGRCSRVFIAVGLCLSLGVPCVASPLPVTILADRVLTEKFLGFGVEWEYEGLPAGNSVGDRFLERRWSDMTNRVDFMRPAILRVMHDARMYTRLENGRFVPDYESPRMRSVYRILDYAAAKHIPVVFGEWWLHESYRSSLSGLDDPRWSDELIVPFLVYLRERRGFANIAYFNLMNEPSGLPVEFETWRRTVLSLHAALDRRGLVGKMRIVGSDGPGDWCQWIGKIARDAELRSCVGAYEYHLYAHLTADKWLPSLLEGRLGPDELALRRKRVNTCDPKGKEKPFFMGEAAIGDGAKDDVQTNRFSFVYGVWMADYAVQSMCAGQSGLIAWDMDDAMHTWGGYGSLGLKGWGFWNSLAGSCGYPEDDFNLRPWFYTWSLLCRCFPAGSQTLEVSATGDPAVRVAAAALPAGGVSCVVVSEAPGVRSVLLRMAADRGGVSLKEYRYFQTDRRRDGDGFPVAAGSRVRVELQAGLRVDLPSRGVVFLSTL